MVNNNNMIHILVSFDKKYILPFQTMLRSMVMNNPKERFHIWLLHSGLDCKELYKIQEYCNVQGVMFSEIKVERGVFEHAPVTKQYPQEMYYRLLAAKFLPDTLDRVLYLDPDILVVNPIGELWRMELGEFTFAAAAHSWGPDMVNDVNRLRLDTEHDYFNTGVLLMDLKKARKLVNPNHIFDYMEEHAKELLLPDQDVFNSLFGKDTKQIDDKLWNYDVRYFYAYKLKGDGAYNMDWVMQNTAILHYCGKNKPWKATNSSRFGVLYKHYMNLTLRILCSL